MAIKLGELFVNLLVKGGTTSKKEVAGVKDEMISMSKSGLASFTAITGVSLGLKHLYDNALQTGRTITQFGNYTELSTDQLQRWQYVAKQSGSTAESMASSIQGLQSSIGQMKLSGPTHEFQKFAELMSLDYGKVNDQSDGVFYMMEQMREFAKRQDLGVTFRQKILGSMGIGQSDIGAMMASKIGPDQVPAGMIRSEGHTKAFNNVATRMQNLQDKMQISFEKVAIKLMPKFSEALEGLMPLLTDIANAATLLVIEIMKGYAALRGNDWNDTWTGIKELFSKSGYLESALGIDEFNDKKETNLKKLKNIQTQAVDRKLGFGEALKMQWEGKKVEINNTNTFHGVSKETSNQVVKKMDSNNNKILKSIQVN